MDTMGKHSKGLIIFAVLATAGLLVPGIGAVFPGGHDTGPIITPPDLNVSSTNFTNRTLPTDHQIIQKPFRVEITISDTLIPGPKGEMQAGPRSIGFPLSPEFVVTFVLAVVVIGAGYWYTLKRKPDQGGAEEIREEGNGDEKGE